MTPAPPSTSPLAATRSPSSSTRRRDRHQLTNLPAAAKIALSAALLAGLVLFLSVAVFGVYVGSFDVTFMNAFAWGALLAELRAAEPRIFAALLGAHALSLLLIVSIGNALFKRTALPRGARTALVWLVMVLGTIDLACWVALPYAAIARSVLGSAVALVGLALVYLIGKPLHEMWVFERWSNPSGRKIRVCFVGGGFGGLTAALALDARLGWHPDLEIVLLDKKNYFLFPPLLPSVAAGSIETRQITYPFRRVLEATNIAFKKEAVERIDLESRVIHARVDVDDDPVTREIQVISSQTPFDYLVLAPGSDTNTFGTKGAAEHAFFMRELGDAIAVRNHIIDCFEHAARDTSAQRRRELLCFVVVGAGPTGVELAAEIRDLVAHVLLRRYPEIAADEVALHVVQSGPGILPGWKPSIVDAAGAQLRALDVDVLCGARVVAVDPYSVELSDGRRLETRTCVWCAGVKPAPLLSTCDLPRRSSGRVEVEADCRVKGRENVFVIGDAAHLLYGGKPLPPLGQVAFQQGSATAANLIRLIEGRATRPFRYFDFGALVSVGEHFASVDLLGAKMNGFVAWIVWRTLYLMKLVGFSNKLRVVLDWTLDLLVERSISQIATTRQEARLAAVRQGEAEPARAAELAAGPDRGA